MTVLQRSSLANHIRRLRTASTGARKASYRDLARATGIPLSVLHAIAKEEDRDSRLDRQAGQRARRRVGAGRPPSATSEALVRAKARQHKPGEMNNNEAAYASQLEERQRAGEIVRYRF